jgi:Carotenoid biosynthesis protein
VLAISLDLAFDAIAIRMGLWTWVGIDPSDGWFGVPYGNFYAWLFVTFGFSLLTRWLRDVARTRPALEWLQLLVPFPAFALLIAGLIPFILIKPLVDPAPGGGGGLFALAMLAFLAIAIWAVAYDRGEPDGSRVAILDLRLATWTRVAIHGYFLAALVLMGLADELPVLLVAAVVLLLAELPLALLVRRRHAQRGKSPTAAVRDATSPAVGYR